YAEANTIKQQPARADSEALRAYPLYPYLQAARIRKALADAGPDLTAADQRAQTVITYYERHPGGREVRRVWPARPAAREGGQTCITYYERDPVGRELRRVWLASLARRELWQTYLEHYRREQADAVEQCHSFTARIALNLTEKLADDIRARYLTPKSLPECRR